MRSCQVVVNSRMEALAIVMRIRVRGASQRTDMMPRLKDSGAFEVQVAREVRKSAAERGIQRVVPFLR